MPYDKIVRHFFNGFVRLHVLYLAANAPTYGAQTTQERRPMEALAP
jgi:hypothetical protein